MLYKEDKEYMEHVGQLIAQSRVQKLKTITHHIYSNRLEHSIHVSYTSYKIAKKLGWDAKSTARGGLLHDMFYYDWRETKFNKSHAWVHPRLAVRNARKVTNLNKVEEDIILKHMGEQHWRRHGIKKAILSLWWINTGQSRKPWRQFGKEWLKEDFSIEKC